MRAKKKSFPMKLASNVQGDTDPAALHAAPLSTRRTHVTRRRMTWERRRRRLSPSFPLTLLL